MERANPNSAARATPPDRLGWGFDLWGMISRVVDFIHRWVFYCPPGEGASVAKSDPPKELIELFRDLSQEGAAERGGEEFVTTRIGLISKAAFRVLLAGYPEADSNLEVAEFVKVHAKGDFRTFMTTFHHLLIHQ